MRRRAALDDRPRSSAGLGIEKDKGQASRRNPLNFLAPRPGLEYGTSRQLCAHVNNRWPNSVDLRASS